MGYKIIFLLLISVGAFGQPVDIAQPAYARVAPTPSFDPNVDLKKSEYMLVAMSRDDVERTAWFFRFGTLTLPTANRIQFWMRLHKYADSAWQRDYEMHLIQAECRAKKTRVIQVVGYEAATGKVKKNYSFDDEAEFPWDNVVPDTVMDGVFTKMCAIGRPVTKQL